jgi:diguanylate cyclase (GGDEF)-like protein
LARTIGITSAPLQSGLASNETLHDGRDDQAAEQDVAELLRSIPLFASFTAEQCTQFIAHSIDQKFPSDHIIIRQGDTAGMVYVILSGHVRVLESVPDSSMQLSLGELGPGQIFGESGVLRDRPRSSSVITLERTRCLAIPPEEFLELLGQSKEMALAVMRLLAGRLYQSDRLLARHAPDPLTGLLGRRAFHELYRKLAAGSKRRRASMLLLVLDILHLKDINDRFGYAVGDDVLRTVADALVECSRSTDLVTRYGGDEFTLLLVEAGAKDAETVMNRVQQKLRQLAVYRNLPLAVECRMGYAASHNPPETAEDFLRIADEDMQRKRPAPAK